METIFTFLVLICVGDGQQCFRIEPEAPTLYQCEMLREDFLKIEIPNQKYYVGTCEEIDVD